MGNKKNKKRSLSESNVAEKTVAPSAPVEVKKKKQKMENTVQNGQPPLKKVKIELTKDDSVNVSKKLAKTKKEKKEVPKTEDVKVKPTVKVSKKKEKKESQKPQESQETKQFSKMGNKLMKLSVEQLKEKIRLIESRDAITKTGKRKLAIYKKYLRVAEEKGASQPDSKSVTKSQAAPQKKKKQLSSESSAESSESQAKVQRAENAGAILKSNKETNEVKSNKNVIVQQTKKQQKKKSKIQSNELIKAQKKVDADDEDDEDEEDEDENEEDNDVDDKNVEEEEEDDDEDEDEAEEKDDDEDEDEEEEEEEEEEDDEDSDDDNVIKKKAPAQTPKKKRYVLFVGNLPYDAKEEDIKQHFLTKVSAITDVRIPRHPNTKKPRGFAYLELPDQVNYEKAYSLDKSFINGRRINVQYTTKDATPNKKAAIVAKNKKLAALQKAGKLAGSKNPGKKQKQKGKPNA